MRVFLWVASWVETAQHRGPVTMLWFFMLGGLSLAEACFDWFIWRTLCDCSNKRPTELSNLPKCSGFARSWPRKPQQADRRLYWQWTFLGSQVWAKAKLSGSLGPWPQKSVRRAKRTLKSAKLWPMAAEGHRIPLVISGQGGHWHPPIILVHKISS